MHPHPDARPSLQSTAEVLIVKPARFYSNPETSADNRFQNPQHAISQSAVQAQVAAEFERFKQMLGASGVSVNCFEIDDENGSPDAIFPNNWFSTHPDGRLILYPLLSPLRRTERRPEILRFLKSRYPRVLDLTHFEGERRFLEGTGSLVLDRVGRVAYACLSARTDGALLETWARELDYRICGFHALDRSGAPIYHTNVMMAIGTGWAVVSLESVPDRVEREGLRGRLTESGRSIIDISSDQVGEFCGNVLEVRNGAGECFVVMSSRAFSAFRESQIAILMKSAKILHCDLELIETLGGGGARCMLAEIFPAA